MAHVMTNTQDLFSDILKEKDHVSPQEVIDRYEISVEKVNSRSFETVVLALEGIILTDTSLRESHNFMAIVDAFAIVDKLENHMSSFSTKKKLEVFQVLSNLQLTVSDSKILPHTYSRKNSVLKGSRTSYVAVSKNDPFKFFDSNKEMELNEWDQISLMQQFERHHKENLPDFSKWIKYTKKKSQIIFFVRMTAHFGQTSSLDIISELLDHEDHEVRKEAILALGILDFVKVEPKLMRIYYSQPEPCQKAIIHAITLFHTGMAFEFLKDAYEAAANIDTKLWLAESLYHYEPEGLEYFRTKIQNEDGFDKVILQHVENPLIKTELAELLEKNKKVKKEKPINSEISKTASAPGFSIFRPALIN